MAWKQHTQAKKKKGGLQHGWVHSLVGGRAKSLSTIHCCPSIPFLLSDSLWMGITFPVLIKAFRRGYVDTQSINYAHHSK